MSLLLKNLYVITADETGSIICDGSIGITGKQIDYIGDYYKGIEAKYNRVLDLKGKAAMPGFVNAHNHVAMTLLRNYADDMKLMDWLFNKIFPMEEKLKEEDIYWGSMLGILEMIKSGTTTFCDMYMFMDRTAETVMYSGIKAALGRGLQGDFNDDGNRLKEGLNLYNNYHGKGDGRIRINLAPHSVYTCTPAYLKQITEAARDIDAEIQIHLSETKDEVSQCLEKYKMTPIKVADEVGLLSGKTIAAHCVAVNGEDIDILKSRDVNIVHNPSSNMKLGSGIAPINKMINIGINVALGTDGASSNNNLDMLKEMRFASYLQKCILEDPTVINADEAIKIATINGAKALGFTDTGMLKKGYAADIIIFDINKPRYYPKYNIKSSIVYSSNSSDVETVIVDGKIIMEKGEVLSIDAEKVMYEAQKIARRLTSS